MNKSDNQTALEELVKGFDYLLTQTLSKRMTQIYNGLIVSSSVSGGKWSVQFNGQIHDLPQYGNVSTVSKGSVVKVFVPNGNINLAFFI